MDARGVGLVVGTRLGRESGGGAGCRMEACGGGAGLDDHRTHNASVSQQAEREADGVTGGAFEPVGLKVSFKFGWYRDGKGRCLENGTFGA